MKTRKERLWHTHRKQVRRERQTCSQALISLQNNSFVILHRYLCSADKGAKPQRNETIDLSGTIEIINVRAMA